MACACPSASSRAAQVGGEAEGCAVPFGIASLDDLHLGESASITCAIWASFRIVWQLRYSTITAASAPCLCYDHSSGLASFTSGHA